MDFCAFLDRSMQVLCSLRAWLWNVQMHLLVLLSNPILSLVWWVHGVVLWWSKSCQWTLHRAVPCREMNASWTRFAVWELHEVPALSLGQVSKPKNSVSSLLDSHFFSFTVSPGEWSLKNDDKCGVKSSVVFGWIWTKASDVIDSLLASSMPAVASWMVCWSTSAAEFRAKISLCNGTSLHELKMLWWISTRDQVLEWCAGTLQQRSSDQR